MPQLQVTVGSASGLHARPASLLVQAAARQTARVTLARPGQTAVDTRSLLSVLALAAKQGEELELTAVGEDADQALAELAALITEDHDAPAAR
ncbi:phosphocarrier protein [Kitasatospora gansuensis]|uniref:Phosphocarrier protein HPr n=1 Tax=Kitasatospora gansuensis TaxID=258050 RepID=A0A7W7WGI4_9ACTN|nr:HPr family phosphocarrier protein [Kitasatospora gansuensis]MBB4945660.1 phosphocarrier protein [Kitasatospora gansuensis]